jgi:cell division initiation protein
MAIRPVDIRRKEFKSGFRGYDANQVDDFLDEVADEFERTFAENQRLSEEMTSLQERMQQFEELESSIREALVHAQQVARDLRRNAGKEAELIVREAKEQAHRILADSSGRVERVQESYEVLRQAKQDFSNDFRHLLKSYLSVMDNADVATAKEIEASLRERLDLESVAAAREAAETRDNDSAGYEPHDYESRDDTIAHDEMSGMERGGGTYEETQRIEAPSEPTGGTDDDATWARRPEPEVEEPEVEPSSTTQQSAQPPLGGQREQGTQQQDFAVRRSEPAPVEGAPGAGSQPTERFDRRSDLVAEEVEREESMPAGENRSVDEFFEQRGSQEDEAEERKIFRASRFLRRRG